MASVGLPAIGKVPQLPQSEQGAILDSLFEPSEELCNLVIPRLQNQTFQSYDEIIALVRSHLDGLSDSSDSQKLSVLDTILGSHPRLGEKKVDSAQSQAEQAQLQSHDEGETHKLSQANQDYEATFPGLRYVVFVNGRSRPTLLEDMKRRIERHDIKQERLDATQAICDIAADRARKLSS